MLTLVLFIYCYLLIFFLSQSLSMWLDQLTSYTLTFAYLSLYPSPKVIDVHYHVWMDLCGGRGLWECLSSIPHIFPTSTLSTRIPPHDAVVRYLLSTIHSHSCFQIFPIPSEHPSHKTSTESFSSHCHKGNISIAHVKQTSRRMKLSKYLPQLTIQFWFNCNSHRLQLQNMARI